MTPVQIAEAQRLAREWKPKRSIGSAVDLHQHARASICEAGDVEQRKHLEREVDQGRAEACVLGPASFLRLWRDASRPVTDGNGEQVRISRTMTGESAYLRGREAFRWRFRW